MISILYIIYIVFTAVAPVTSKSFHLDMFIVTLLADMYFSMYLYVLYATLSGKHTENKIAVLDFLKDIKRKTPNEDKQDGIRRNPPADTKAQP